MLDDFRTLSGGFRNNKFKRELAEAMLPFYRHVAKQTLEHGKDWPKTELQRINALIKSDAVRHKKKTDFMYKRNVLNSFV